MDPRLSVASAPAAPPTAAAAAGAEAPWLALERTFAAIAATRMAGVPVLNPALRVEAVGFRRWDGRWLGVLITPWFMNLVLLRDAPAAWRPLPQREICSYTLPAGVYDFLGSEEDGLGDFQMCSLFSPMQDFADQDGARAVAGAVMAAVFDPATRGSEHGPDDRAAAAAAPPADATPSAPAATTAAPAGAIPPSPAAGPAAHPASPARRAFFGGARRPPGPAPQAAERSPT